MKRKVVTSVVAMFVLAILVCVISISFYKKYQAEQNTFRCYVFGELIKPGMAREEVEKILHQFGEYRVNESRFKGFYQLHIIFENGQAHQKFGTDNFVLDFSNDQFKYAWQPYKGSGALPMCQR